MKIKVCGLKDPSTITAIENLKCVDYSGLIFYEKSPRFVGDLKNIPIKPLHIQRVGVFVNPNLNEVIDYTALFSLDFIQLHGTESNSFCAKVKKEGYGVIKAISIATAKDFELISTYEAENIDYFLLDTSTPKYGGSGKKFNWQLLKYYEGSVPYFLSGGISPEDKNDILNIDNKHFKGIDLNSRFEIKPGEKDEIKIQGFIKEIKF